MSPRVVGRQRTAARTFDGGDALAIAVPSLFFLHPRFVGQVYMPEVLLAGLLPPLALARRDRLRALVAPTFVVLGLVWLYGQIATDVYRDTPLTDLARGWANIVVTLIDFSSIALLLDRRAKRYVLFAAGIALGQLLDFAVNHNDLGYPWKFGIAIPVSIALVLAACTRPARRVRFLASIVLGAGALLNLLRDYRSLSLILLLAGIYLVFADQPQARRSAPLRRVVVVAVVIALGGFGLNAAYSAAARSGALGLSAQQTYLVESARPYGILGGGRPEFHASFHAILDSPLLGHGSWALDPKYLVYLQGAGITGFNSWTQSGLIPAHSYIAGGWVDAGILAVPIWLWVFALLCRVLVRAVGTGDRLLPLVAYAAMSLAWAIPFSPYDGPNRLPSMFYVLVLIFGLERARSAAMSA